MYYNNSIYREDLKSVFNGNIQFEKIKGSSILVTGASGMIGSFLVDVLMLCNDLYSLYIDVFAMSRNKISLEKRFKTHYGNPHFHILQHDVTYPLVCNYQFDFIIHAASNAYPQAFATDPVGTMMGNIQGVYNLLEYARQKGIKKFLFISSGEIYGQGTESISAFDESYSGYIDSTNPRSCYPNSKRAAETLCVSYTKQYKIDTVIARPCHIYGPTATSKDNRVSSQFINNIIAGNDIIMKSSGSQLRSYCYVADCVSGVLTILLSGKTGSAYNIANKNSNVTIREMAEMIADISGKKVVFELPDEFERAGYNPVTKSILNASKLESLGWSAKYDLKNGLIRTIEILKQVQTRN
ncbi:NAD-dependent epimerase/dehydratase family protein [Thermoanaerobacterium thermosaccharolyticum]|uniref:NAD-dependent epimerase/dehydratase family protein n=1 Tax=Thermoanaerobacterium thermosaccharolyticum TaxID=1517 RepID=UPI00279FF76B|nr:NAD-dependent epimerase/dehydratase family protein [Thermoanaerobacterium thermosaccharolyticum]